jgi:hypothetical protein
MTLIEATWTAWTEGKSFAHSVMLNDGVSVSPAYGGFLELVAGHRMTM